MQPVEKPQFANKSQELPPSGTSQAPDQVGPKTQLNTSVADNPKAPDRLKKIAKFLKQAVTHPPALLLKGIEYVALAGFSVASIPAIMAMPFGEEIEKRIGKTNSRGEIIAFQVVSLVISPILIPLAFIGLGAAIAGSTLKALGSGTEEMGIWLKLHIARRAHQLHEDLGNAYFIDFHQIAQNFETAALNNLSKKCVNKDWNTFKTKAENLRMPGNEEELKSAWRHAKVDYLAQHLQPKDMHRDVLKMSLEQQLEIKADEDHILEEMIDLYLKKQKEQAV